MHRRGRRRGVSARRRCREIYDALKLDEIGLTLEVQQQLGDGIVRTIALGSLRRPAPRHEGGEHRRRSWCRSAPRRSAASWTCWAARSTSAARSAPTRPMSIHRDGADVRRTVAVDRAARDGHQGHRPDLPVREGRQDRPVRRRRRRQDRQHDGAHQQHRDRALGPVGVRRRRRAHARRQRLLPRDDRLRRRRQGRPVASRRWRWCSAR